MDDPKDDALAATNGSGRRKAQHSNDSAAQRRRLLAALQVGPITTIEARRDLDVLMPAARVFELRAVGYRITTYRVEQRTECGRLHNVARYGLATGAADDSGGSRAIPMPKPPIGQS